jgi:hypothetical protein
MPLSRFSSIQQPLGRIYKPSSSPGVYWIASLGAVGINFFGRDIAVDSNQNVYVAGDHNVSGSFDIGLAKYNSSGIIQWQRSLRSAGFDRLGNNGLAVGGNGDVYICGNSDSSGGTGTEIIIAKYNTNGSDLWQRRLGNAAENTAGGIAVDSGGNVYITGAVGSASMTVAKYNTSGVIQWQRDLSSSGWPRGAGIAVDTNGNAYIAGSVGQIGSAALICKYNTSGTLQWQRNLDTANQSPRGVDIAVDTNGNSYIGGWFTNTATATQDFFLAKYNTSGVIQWQRQLHGTFDTATGVAVDGSANAYIIGYSAPDANNDFIIVKYDTSGVLQWQRRLATSNPDFSGGMATDSNGDVYVSGQTQIGGTPTRRDFLFAKLPPDGTKTGTYTVGSVSVTYSVSTLTDSAGTLTDNTNIATDSAGALTDAATTLTVINDANSFTSSRTLI